MAHDEQQFTDGWTQYSDWLDDINENNANLIDALRAKIAPLKKNEEVFSSAWQDDDVKSALKSLYLKDKQEYGQLRKSRIGKSVGESKRWRDLGNVAFNKGDYMLALDNYTQAVRYAPYPNKESSDDSLALALANRSVALFSMTRYRLCLSDIELATKYGYPKHRMFKLLVRKVKCLHILSVWTNDVEQIKEDLRDMLKSQEVPDAAKREIQSMFDFIDQTRPEDMLKDELDVVDETTMKLSNASKSLPQATDCVEMSYEINKGRYIITNKDVSAGRLLIAEEPFVCNLAPSKRDEYCYNCFGRLNSCGLGCRDCTQILYCSEECLHAKEILHKNECNQLLDLQEKLGVSYLVAHIMFKIRFNLDVIPIHSRKATIEKSHEQILEISASQWPDIVYRNDYAAVLALMDHALDYSDEERCNFAITSVYLMHALIDTLSDRFPILKDEESHVKVGSVILRHIQQLQTNLISILDQNLQAVVVTGHSMPNIQEHPIGTGIYPTVSLLNHSCTPNIFSIFHRNKFIARASTNLECGTEVNYCYGPSVARMSKKDRQRKLRNQYFFRCYCQACEFNQENKSRCLRCNKCTGPVIYHEDLSQQCLSNDSTCAGKAEMGVKEALKFLADKKRLVEELSEDESSLEPEKKYEKLDNISKQLAAIFHEHNPIFVQIKSELTSCALAMQKYDLAVESSESELDILREIYGENSYESIMAKLTYVNVKWQALYNQIEDAKTEPDRQGAICQLKELLSTIGGVRAKLKDLLASTNISGAEASFEMELKFLSDVHSSIVKYLED